jgi:predicted amidophosphoribosyltransferase
MIEDFKFYYKKDIAENFSDILVEKFKNSNYDNKENYIIIYPPMYFFKRILR